MDAPATLGTAMGDLPTELLMGESASGIDDADDALVVGDLDGDLVIVARPICMHEHVRARFGQRELYVVHALGRDAEILEGTPTYAAHDRNTDGIARELKREREVHIYEISLCAGYKTQVKQ